MRLCRLRPVLVALVAVALATPAAPAAASLATWTFSGSLAWAEPGNSLGLSAGDAIAGHATFDESLVPAAGQFFLAVGGPGLRARLLGGHLRIHGAR